MNWRQRLYFAVGMVFVLLLLVGVQYSMPDGAALAQISLQPTPTSTPMPTPTPAPPPPTTGYDPYLLKDINPSGPTYLGESAVFDGRLFLSAHDGTHGAELWVTDGTTGGTTLLKDINPGSGASYPNGFAAFDGHLFFEANDGTCGSELWVTDGTTGGTILLKDINPGTGASYPNGFAAFDGHLFFEANDGTHGYELWMTDGTTAGTTLLKDINPGPAYSRPGEFAVFDGHLFFRADDGTHGSELWMTDGTAGGTTLLKDIDPGTGASYPAAFAAFGRLFLTADDGAHGRELWVTDGTAGGTALFKDIDAGAGASYPNGFAAFDDRLFFEASEGTHGAELWVTDGTAGGTTLLKDINPGSSSSYPNGFAASGGRLFFEANDGTHGTEPWVTDGTAGGTSLLKDINPGTWTVSNSGERFAAFDGHVFFEAEDGIYGSELWVTDGTADGTVVVEDINPGWQGSQPLGLTAFGEQLLFAAYDGTHGWALWAMGSGVAQRPPVADDDSYSTSEGTPLDVPDPGVLANDSDADGDSIMAVLDITTVYGSLIFNSDGSFRYTPGPGFCALDDFRYHANDGQANSSVAIVTIDVLCVNEPPVADDDSYGTDEDIPLTVDAPGVLDGDMDADGDPLTALLDATASNGSLILSSDGSFSYTPEPGFCGLDNFGYHANDGQADSNIATVTIDVLCINDPPVADDDSYSTDEDIPLNVPVAGVLDGDTDADGDPMTAVLDAAPSNGALTLNSDGSFSYTPDADSCAMDSFTYHADDGEAGSNIATVAIEVVCVDDPPTVSVDIGSQTVQYSDRIASVTISAADVDSAILSINADLPSGLTLAESCTPSGSGVACIWTLAGQILVAQGTYDLTFTVSDGTNHVDAQVGVVVEPEDATVAFDGGNEISVPAASDGGNSGPFSLLVHITEFDDPAGVAGDANLAGDINEAQVSMSLAPVGPGATVVGTCTSLRTTQGSPDGDSPFTYDVLTVECFFDGVEVNTFDAVVTVDGGFYAGIGEDVLTVYDPSLGLTTGGGWFYWPGTDERTNFGYTVKYNKKGTKVQGSLLLIRHLADGSIYRVKSNALEGLSLGNEGSFGWSSFSGKTTYLEPGWPEPIGNYAFVVYVEDRGEPGANADRFWIEVRDKAGNPVTLSLPPEATDNALVLNGGNISVPNDR